MTEGLIQVAPDSTGKKVRTQEVAEGLNTVEQQVVTIANADGTLVDSTTVTVGNFPATQPVSGTVGVSNFPGIQPVSGTVTANAGTGPSTAWKVDLSATAANATPVKVDNSAVTQPISAATLPLPSGASTAAKQPALGTAGSASADVLSVQGIAAMTPLKVDGSAVTQPASLASLPNPSNLDVALSTRLKPADTLAGVTTVTTVSAVTAITNALPAGANLIGHVDVDAIVPPTLTKGTQGTTGFAVQNLKDAGRTFVVLSADRVAGATSEALISFSKNVGGVVTAGQTTYTVTAGKTLRIQIFQIEIIDTTTTANRSIQRLRGVLSGTATATSPVLLQAVASSTGALATGSGQETYSIPDGLELPAGANIGVSHLENITTAGIVSMLLVGYEY